MENCCNILSLDAGALADSYEIKSTLSVTLFACCSLGMVFSTTALILLLLTALFFEEWRKVYKNQLLLQFMLARFFFTLVRYETELRRFINSKEKDERQAYIETFLITYTEIAVVAWMFLFTKQMYDNFVRILFVEITLWKISLAAWVIPIVITTAFFFACVYKNIVSAYFMIYLMMAKWPVLLANGVLLIIVLKTILSENKSRKIKNRRIVIVMIMLILSFSVHQIIWDLYKLLHAVDREKNLDVSPLFFKLTSIFTVFQCAASILFWLCGNRRTRVMWGMEKEKSIKKKSSLTSVCTVQITKL